MSTYMDLIAPKLKLNNKEEEQLRSHRTNVWFENDSSLTSGIADNSTISDSSESSPVLEAIMDELADVLRGPSSLVRVRELSC